MKFLRNFTFICILVIGFTANANDSIIKADSSREKAEEVIRVINAGLGSDEIQVALVDTKIKDFLVRNLETYSEKINTEQGRYLLYFSLATAFFNSGNSNEAHPLLLKALALAEKLKNIKYQCGAYNLMANLFAETNMTANAFQYFRRTLKLATELKDEVVMCTLYNNFATCFYRAWESDRTFLDSARLYNGICLKLALKLDRKQEIHLSYQTLGLIETDANNYKEAEIAFRTALKLSGELKVSHLRYYTLYQLGRMFADEGSKILGDSAIKYLTMAKNEATADGDFIIVNDILYETARAYRNTGNFKLSSFYALRFAEYNDSLMKFENSRLIAEMNEKYETAKNEAKINELNLVQIEKEAQINRQFYFIFGGVIILILVGIVAFSLYRSNQIRKRVNTQLNEKNKLIEKQKEIVDSKNKAILDSIYYAKRIQQSLLPTVKYLERNLKKLKKEDN